MCALNTITSQYVGLGPFQTRKYHNTNTVYCFIKGLMVVKSLDEQMIRVQQTPVTASIFVITLNLKTPTID